MSITDELLPKTWSSTSLSNIALINPRLDKSQYPDELEVTFVPMPAVEAGTGVMDASQVRRLGDVKKGYTPFQEGDVLFAKITPCMENGKMAVVPALTNNLGFGSTEFHVVRPRAGIDARYLYYYISSEPFRREAERNMTGAVGQRRVPAAFLENHGIPVPPSAEQCRIVAKIEELFAELDKGVESLKTAWQQLKVYRQSLLKHAFDGKLTAEWRRTYKSQLESVDGVLARVPAPGQPRGGREASTEVIEGVAALAVNKPNKVPPQGWKWVPLLRVARQETGHTPSRKYSSYWGGRKYWISIPDARQHHGRVINDTLQKATAKGLDNSAARTLPQGTVCLSRTASVGYVCIMGKPMATSQDFATWTCTDALNPRFLMYALMAEGNELRRFGKGTTHTTIYFPEIRALHICLPPIREQNVIVDHVEEKLEQVSAAAAEIETQLTRAEMLRRAILQAAFTGRLVPQDANDEPAFVLLERIKADKADTPKPLRTRKLKVAA